MSLCQSEFIKCLESLAEVESLKATVNGAAMGALITGACTFAGGLLGGPVGMIAGAAVGSIGAASQSNFKSVVSIIQEDLSDHQKTELVNRTRRILNSINAKDSTVLLGAILSQPSLKKAVITELGNFLKNELNYTLTQ